MKSTYGNSKEFNNYLLIWQFKIFQVGMYLKTQYVLTSLQ